MGDDLDPFGRKKDENPLAALGWEGDETASTAEAQPEAERSPEPPRPAEPQSETWREQPEPQPQRRERPAASASAGESSAWSESPASSAEAERIEVLLRSQIVRSAGSGIGRLVRTAVVIVVVFAVIAAVISALAGEGIDRVDRYARQFDPPVMPVPAVPGGDEGRSGRPQATLPARGLSVNSLLRPAAFRRAMARLRTGGYGRLANLRVAPDRINATMTDRDGDLRLLQIVPGGRVEVLQTTAGGFAGAPTMTLRGIDTGAPNRLTRSAAERLRVPASRVDYLVLMEFAGTRQWNAYFKGGRIFAADARGRITRRIS